MLVPLADGLITRRYLRLSLRGSEVTMSCCSPFLLMLP